MRLRTRLLWLIALLISGALSASFLLIYSAVRQQTLNDLDASLAVARRVWDTLSKSQAQSLVASATSMAGEAGFVTVLRATDRATLLDYLHEAQKNNPLLDLVLVLDDQGRLRVRTDAATSAPAAGDPLLAAALDGVVGAAFWNDSTGLYLVAVAPVLLAGDRLDGALVLGIRLDQEFVDQLAKDTHTLVSLDLRGQTLYSGGLAFSESGPSRRSALGLHTVQSPLPGWDGKPAGRLVLARDLNAALGYMKVVTGQLAGLGMGVLALAFFVSVPLVGRVSNPVEQLTKTQAEMAAVFQANVDGLVALDQAGRVVSANPAAAVCLGLSVEALVGRSLEELLPAPVFSRLIAVPPSSGQLVQRSEYQREGREFQLIRTFVPSAHLEVGSVLVTRDVSAERGRGQLRLLARLRETLLKKPQSEADWRRWEKDHLNLWLLAGGSLTEKSPPPAELPAELERLKEELEVPLDWEGELPSLDLSAQQLRLLLLNLASASSLSFQRQGGGCWLTAAQVELSSWDREAVEGLLSEIEGRLEHQEGQLRIWLPARL